MQECICITLEITSSVAQLVKNPPAIQETACNNGDAGLIPELGRSPGEGNDNPLQCSCLENPMVRGACSLQAPQSMGSQRVRHD